MRTDLSASTQRRHRSSTRLFISARGAVLIGAILMGCAGAVASLLILAEWLRDIMWTATLAEFQTTT